MIRLVEALHFKCLKYIRQPLGPFHVLVGPNATGKTTFLDVPALLGDLVSRGLDEATSVRTHNFQDLLWQRIGMRFELAIELSIPEHLRQQLEDSQHSLVRYEVALGTRDEELSILNEKVLLKHDEPGHRMEPPPLFPVERIPPRTLITPKGARGVKTVVNKVPGGNDNFYDETGKGWDHAFKLGPRKSALGNLPEDESKFPVASWLKKVLTDGVQKLVLNSVLMRKPSPPGQPKRFRPDGSNLPWVIERLKRENPERYEDWIRHIRTSLSDVRGIRTTERPEDRHRYLEVCYGDGLVVPSWAASDGTLRLLELTLLAYLPALDGIYLIEEPENGIHPRAVETMFQSLSSVYDAQVLAASHSPVVLNAAEAHQVLCFSKTDTGAVDIVSGSDHPGLRDWKGETTLGVLFASGVLE